MRASQTAMLITRTARIVVGRIGMRFGKSQVVT